MKAVAGQPRKDVRDTVRNVLWRTVRNAGAAGMNIEVLQRELQDRFTPGTVSQMANMLRKTKFLTRTTPRQGPFVVTEECRVPAGEEPHLGPGFAAATPEDELRNAILCQVATAGPVGIAPDELVALVARHPQQTIDAADRMVRDGSLIRSDLFQAGYALPREPVPSNAPPSAPNPAEGTASAGALTADELAACVLPQAMLIETGQLASRIVDAGAQLASRIVDAGAVVRFRCALDSDGTLTIQSHGLNGTIPKEDVRRLVTYLGRFEDFGVQS